MARQTKNESENIALQPSRASSNPSFFSSSRSLSSAASSNSDANNNNNNASIDSSSDSVSNNDSSLVPHTSNLSSFQPSYSKATLKIIEKYQVSIMSLIFTISCKINVPELRPCIPYLFDILESNSGQINLQNSMVNQSQNSNSNPPFASFGHSLPSPPSSSPSSAAATCSGCPQHRKESMVHSAFLCLCVLAKYGSEKFDLNLLTLFAAKYVNYENQISQDASAFELTSYAQSITNLDDVICVFFIYLKNEKQQAVANFGKMLIKLAEKNGKNVSAANLSRLKSTFQ